MADEDRILCTERTVPFPPATVYMAFAISEVLAEWWGPDGFTNSFETFDFRSGGDWKFQMHGPDGTSYENKNIFITLVPGSRLVIRHDCAPFFTLTVRLTAVSGGTHLSWEQAFDDARTAQAVKDVVEPANEQNLNRLTRALERRASAG